MEADLPFEIVRVSDALARRRFQVRQIYIDEFGTRLDYVVNADPRLRWPFPSMQARDHGGAEYPPRGGAAAPAVDGRSNGTLTVDRPVDGTSELTLTVTWEADDEQVAEIRVSFQRNDASS